MIELYLSEDEWRTFVRAQQVLHESSDAVIYDDGDILSICEDARGDKMGKWIAYTRSAAAIRDFGESGVAREDADREAGRMWDD